MKPTTSPYRRCARAFRWLAACSVGLNLAACGGGDDSPATGPGAAAGTGNPAAVGTFIAPSGPLCSKILHNGNCAQPTSSAIDQQGLIDAILDPKGPVIEFDSMGLIVESVLKYRGPKSPETGYTYPFHGMARRRVEAGRNSFTIDTKHYAIVDGKNSDAEKTTYGNGRDEDIAQFFITTQPHDLWDTGRIFNLAESRDVSRTGSWSGNSRTESASIWSGTLRLLTDQSDAPTDQEVHYVGFIQSFSGDGKWLSERERNRLGAGASYEAVFDTGTGKLSGVRVDYTDPVYQTRIQMELPKLYFRDSRLIKDAVGHRIDVRNAGPADPADVAGSTYIQNDFRTDGLEGEIYGKQAATIYLVGSGPNGRLQVALIPKKLFDQMPDEDKPIPIPLSRRAP